MPTNRRAKAKKGKRAAGSVAALAKAGLGVAESAKMGPRAGALVTASIAGLVEHARRIVTDRRERRILAGVAAEKRRSIIENIETDERAATEYAALLEKVWDDDEDAKTGVYARLLRTDVDGRTRQHLVRSVRELAVADFDVLKTALRIGGPWPEPALKDLGGGFVQPAPASAERDAHYNKQAKFLEESDPLTLAGIQRLEHAGFVHRPPVFGGRIDVTPLGRLLLEAVAAEPHSGG